MKHQALFSSKDKSEILKCRLLQFLFGALRVKIQEKKLFYILLRNCLILLPETIYVIKRIYLQNNV